MSRLCSTVWAGCLASLVFLCQATGGNAQEPPVAPVPMRVPTVLELHDGLQELAAAVPKLDPSKRGGFDYLSARILIGRCALSGDSRLMGELRTIAETCHSNYGLPIYALDALWRLGENRSYFLQLVEGYSSRIHLAGDAAQVLARDPRDGEIARFAQIVQLAESGDLDDAGYVGVTLIANAAGEAKRLQEEFKRFEELKTFADQLEFLFTPCGGSDYCAITHCCVRALTDEEKQALSFDPTNPRLTWIRAQIERLSSSKPMEAARALCKARFGAQYDEHEPEEARAYCLSKARDEASRALTREARSMYVNLSPPLPDPEIRLTRSRRK
jgi:hypothetical protein